MHKRLLPVLLALFTLAALTGLGPALAQDNVLVMARSADTTGLDPHTQTAFSSHRLLELIYEPLVELDSGLNLVPALAESWAFNDDATTLTLNLRAGVSFHDGSVMDSADVRASFERILDEETGAAARSRYTGISSIETPDALTVVFGLDEPNVPLLGALASINGAIISEEEAASGDFSGANGTGAFVLDEWTPEEVTTLSANAAWWGDGPQVDGIEMRIIPDEASILAALRVGEIDFALLNDPLIATLLIGDDSVQLNRIPSISYHVLQLNASREPMDQLAVRQALSCAIDRQQILETVALGEGSVTGPLTSAAYAVPLEDYFCYERDVELARSLLADAGLADGFSLSFIAANAEPPTALAEAQTLQAQLAEIGVTVEIESLELGTYIDRWLAADFDGAVAFNGGRPDPYTMYSRYWTRDGNLQKVANYIDDTLDDLMAQGKVETDPAARYEIFADFQKHLVEAAPWLWLYTGYEYSAQQAWVSGFAPHPGDKLTSFSAVSLDR